MRRPTARTATRTSRCGIPVPIARPAPCQQITPSRSPWTGSAPAQVDGGAGDRPMAKPALDRPGVVTLVASAVPGEANRGERGAGLADEGATLDGTGGGH
jgi:hypothetical protein